MRFLLAAVIIQDIGLPLDSNHSGEIYGQAIQKCLIGIFR